jgi:hypothetical protein
MGRRSACSRSGILLASMFDAPPALAGVADGKDQTLRVAATVVKLKLAEDCNVMAPRIVQHGSASAPRCPPGQRTPLQRQSIKRRTAVERSRQASIHGQEARFREPARPDHRFSMAYTSRREGRLLTPVPSWPATEPVISFNTYVNVPAARHHTSSPAVTEPACCSNQTEKCLRHLGDRPAEEVALIQSIVRAKPVAMPFHFGVKYEWRDAIGFELISHLLKILAKTLFVTLTLTSRPIVT